jgi:hypothetical protein
MKTWIPALSHGRPSESIHKSWSGSFGGSFILHDIIFLITKAIITLFEMIARLVTIAPMPVLLRVLVVSVVAVFIEIVTIMLVMAITSVIAVMMIVPVTKIVQATMMTITAMHLVTMVVFARTIGLGAQLL